MITYGQSIHDSIEKKLKEDPRVILLGEDICDPYGGAFKITRGLSSVFGERVLNTPMSEWALVGVATGMAMRGMRPVLEIMFGDFLTLCADQIINHTSKFSWMYNSQVSVPLVIRTPMGGRRGYGPTHSQTLEKLFLGIPGIKVIAPSHCHNPGQLLVRSIDDNNPVLFIEHKQLYPRKIGQENNGYIFDFAFKKTDEQFPTLRLSNTDFEDDRVTIVTYGGMLPYVLEAVSEVLIEDEVGIEVVVPCYINNSLDNTILDSVKKTGKMIIAEEGNLSNGWGAELAALVGYECFNVLKKPIQRIGAKNVHLAATKTLEDETLPQVNDIKLAIKDLI